VVDAVVAVGALPVTVVVPDSVVTVVVPVPEVMTEVVTEVVVVVVVTEVVAVVTEVVVVVVVGVVLVTVKGHGRLLGVWFGWCGPFLVTPTIRAHDQPKQEQ
jgi:hypothetical protein